MGRGVVFILRVYIVNREIAKDIIATIVYYDVLDYPLTAFEVWKHLINAHVDKNSVRCHMQDIELCLRRPEVQKYISEKNGFYFLTGREKLVALRKEREIISLRKIQKLRKIVSFLRCSPFVRMICVTGRLAYRNCEEDSDLDVLVAYKGGHIWTGRFCMTVLAHICGVRRYGSKTSDRVCLNYHITTDSLGVPTRDLFAAHEYSFTFPLYDNNHFFDAFCAQNAWIKNYHVHYVPHDEKKHALTIGDNLWSMLVRSVGELILGDKGMENRLRKVQKNKIARNPQTMREGALIFYNDQHLIFLPQPHGPEVFEEYKKRLDALEIDL